MDEYDPREEYEHPGDWTERLACIAPEEFEECRSQAFDNSEDCRSTYTSEIRNNAR